MNRTLILFFTCISLYAKGQTASVRTTSNGSVTVYTQTGTTTLVKTNSTSDQAFATQKANDALVSSKKYTDTVNNKLPFVKAGNGLRIYKVGDTLVFTPQCYYDSTSKTIKFNY